MTPLILLRLALAVVGIASTIATGAAIGDVARFSVSLTDVVALLLLASVAVAAWWAIVATVGLDLTDL